MSSKLPRCFIILEQMSSVSQERPIQKLVSCLPGLSSQAAFSSIYSRICLQVPMDIRSDLLYPSCIPTDARDLISNHRVPKNNLRAFIYRLRTFGGSQVPTLERVALSCLESNDNSIHNLCPHNILFVCFRFLFYGDTLCKLPLLQHTMLAV